MGGMHTPLWVMIAGPYRSGTATDAERESNRRRLNEAAVAVWQRGHLPIIGINHALPLIAVAGEAAYEAMMMPLSLALAERCDAVLRIGGPSRGADDEVAAFVQRGLPVYTAVDQLPLGPRG